MRAARFYDRGDIRVDEINEKGVDAAFECTSVQPGFDACLDAIRMGGTVVIVAIWGKPLVLIWQN